MAKRKLNHLTDLSHLFATTADIIVADLVQRLFNLFPLDRFTFVMDYSIRGYNTVWRWIGINNLQIQYIKNIINP